LKKYNPFLKWAGGKRWFVKSYAQLFPNNFNIYHEPFLGSGVVFFYLAPKKSVLSDINSALINTYVAIKSDSEKVKRRLQFHNRSHCTEHYYRIRSGIKGSLYAQAGDFIYLNRTCWNGLYRVNNVGKFNVPIGDRDSIIRESDDFISISELLKHSDLNSRDFTDSIEFVEQNDFCFIDPPYTVKHDNNGFLRYNENIFSWSNQESLRDEVVKLKNRGGKALILNANHSSIKELYKGVGKIIPLSRHSMLAANSRNRGVIKEIAIMVGYEK